jgi:Alcohol dehydrogenase GroES-associated
MKALVWHAKGDVRCETVPDPRFGSFMNKGLTLEDRQTHVKRYSNELLGKIDSGEIDPSFVITHKRPLEEGPELYKTFCDKEDGYIKVVLKPQSLGLFPGVGIEPTRVIC